MMNTCTKNIKNVLNVFTIMMMSIAEQKKRFQQYARINDYDTIVSEVIQVFIIKLIINLVVKYRSEDDKERRDALYSCKLLAIISTQFLEEKKPHYRQFEAIFNEVVQWVVANRGKAEEV